MPDETKPTVRSRLLEIQRELKVKKGQWNSYGKYSYRSKEDILEAAKPLCHARGLVILCRDEVQDLGGWRYVRTLAEVVDAETGESVFATGLAREPETKKGMDASQITGTASSYAGKRALGNLFAIDDTKDSDSQPPEPERKRPPEQGPFVAHCQHCGTRYQFADAGQYDAFLRAPGCCPTPDWVVD